MTVFDILKETLPKIDFAAQQNAEKVIQRIIKSNRKFFIQQCADQKAVMDLAHNDIPKFKIDEETDKLYFYGWKVDGSFDIDSFETPDYIEIEVDKL